MYTIPAMHNNTYTNIGPPTVRQVDAVDTNPGQTQLTLLRYHAMLHLSNADYRALLGLDVGRLNKCASVAMCHVKLMQSTHVSYFEHVIYCIDNQKPWVLTL